GDSDPTDNAMLDSPFRIPDDQYDVSCQAQGLTTLSDDGTTVIAHADAGALKLGAGVADLEVYQVLVHLTVSADQTQMTADMGAAWSACALLQGASGVAGYSGLELILQ